MVHRLIDRVFARYAARRPMFTGGWGEAALLDRFDAAFVASAEGGRRISWSAPHRRGRPFVRDGRFDAGLADLPAGARTAHVRHVGVEDNRAACVLLAGSREEGFAMRESVYGPLALRGIDLLILENPYYGMRRPLSARSPSVPTVSDQVQMNVATLIEALALLGWARARYERLAVAGYSMGGHMAALTGVLHRAPIAIGAFATGACPSSIYTRGALARSVAFPALSARGDGAIELAGLFARADLTTLPAPAVPSAASLVAMEFDEYVLRSETERLAAHWPGASLRFEKAGHVTGILLRRTALRDAIAEAIARLP
jgi:hypothetical protein